MALTNLTGTKWTINSINCTAGYGQFNVNYNYSGSEGDQIYIGYRYEPNQQVFDDTDESIVPTANKVLLMPYLYSPTIGLDITITGGTDATNANLISWLESHATQIIPEISKIKLPSNQIYTIKDEIARESLANKQDTLVSGTNIKTINNSSILGSGNISIEGGIKEISTQYIRITDLAAGVYKLTYNGTKYLYYNGTSSTTTHTVTGGTGAVVLVVSKYSTTYWHWWYINGSTSYATLYFGYTTSSSGSTSSKSISSLYTGTPSNYYPIRSYTSGLQISSYSGSSNCQLYVPYATYSQFGVVKPAYSTSGTATLTTSSTSYSNSPTINARTTTSGKYYAVETDSAGRLYVNVPWEGGSGMTNPMTTAGDIIVGGSSGTPTRLAKGTANQVLKMNSAGTSIEWGTGGGAVSDVQVNGTSVLSSGVANIVTETAYDASSNKIATMSDLPTGEVDVTLNGTATSTTHTLTNIVVGTDTYLMPKLYQHTIKFFKTYAGGHPSGCVYFTFLSQSSTAVSTLSDLLTALKNAGYDKKNIQASGYYYFSSSNTSKNILAVYPNKDGSSVTAYYFDTSNWSEGSSTLISASTSNYTITDDVIQIM